MLTGATSTSSIRSSRRSRLGKIKPMRTTKKRKLFKSKNNLILKRLMRKIKRMSLRNLSKR